jgi:polar amino acid transport system ATP-binding protein
MSEVRFLNVHKSFGAMEVLKGINFTVDSGQVACLIGPSGSGKSTLLRCVNHLETTSSGAIMVGGRMIGYEVHGDHLIEAPAKEINKRRSRIGMVFQSFNLFGHMTALENVMMGPVKLLKVPKAQAEAEARELLAKVGLADRTGHYPAQLSGGQQQRVAIARALSMKPDLMLFDEPTSALDPELVGEVLDVRGHPRNGLCPRSGRHRGLHGRRRHRGGRRPQRDHQPSPARAHPSIPFQGSVIQKAQ